MDPACTMVSELFGDFYRFRRDWKLVRLSDWTRVILSVILGGIGLGLMLAPFIMVLLRKLPITPALSVATLNVLVGLVLFGIGKMIFDRAKEQQILIFVYYTGTVISMIIFLVISLIFYTRLAYVVTAG